MTADSPDIVLQGRWSTGASFFDYDHDGRQDLIILNYLVYSMTGHVAFLCAAVLLAGAMAARPARNVYSVDLFSAARGNPLAISYPTDGSVLIIAPSAIVKGTKHPNAAKLFMEYLNSVEASKINTKHFAVPLRPEVPAPPGAKPVSEVKTVRPTIAEIDKGVPEVIEQWRDTFGN